MLRAGKAPGRSGDDGTEVQSIATWFWFWGSTFTATVFPMPTMLSDILGTVDLQETRYGAAMAELTSRSNFKMTYMPFCIEIPVSRTALMTAVPGRW